MRTPGRCSAGPAHSQAIVPGRCVTPWSSCTSSLLPPRPRRSRSRWVGRRRGRFARRRERSCSQKGEGHQQLWSADLAGACGHFKRKMALALIDQALIATKIVANLQPARHSSSKLPMLAQVAPHLCQRGFIAPICRPQRFRRFGSVLCCDGVGSFGWQPCEARARLYSMLNSGASERGEAMSLWSSRETNKNGTRWCR